MRISVIIPSRLGSVDRGPFAGRAFVERALDSVVRQTVLGNGTTIDAIVAVDPGQGAAARGLLGARARVVESQRAGQAEALNAALAQTDGSHVAFLEDDDQWSPDFLAHALDALPGHAFASSTQLLVDSAGAIVRVMDFATPSGWLMPRTTLERVGSFDPGYRWHLDNDWLGRLGEAALPRVHLVEATAPLVQAHVADCRVELDCLLRFGGPAVTLRRHASPWPLVLRAAHAGSGMAMIAADEAKLAESRAEYARLRARYGHVPW